MGKNNIGFEQNAYKLGQSLSACKGKLNLTTQMRYSQLSDSSQALLNKSSTIKDTVRGYIIALTFALPYKL